MCGTTRITVVKTIREYNTLIFKNTIYRHRKKRIQIRKDFYTVRSYETEKVTENACENVTI